MQRGEESVLGLITKYNIIVDMLCHTVNVRVQKLKIKLQYFTLLLTKLDLCIFFSIKNSSHFDVH